MSEGLSRAERRRLARHLEKQKVQYTFSNEDYYDMQVQMRKDAFTKMEERFIKVFFSMPLKILHEKFKWSPQNVKVFADELCKEYQAYLYGQCTDEKISEYVKITEELTGIRFER